MGYASDYYNALKKLKKEKEEEEFDSSYAGEYHRALSEIQSTNNYATTTRASESGYVAPVKGGNKDSVFKSGGFSDGVDSVGDFFGDLGETILGTVGDIGVNIVQGVSRLGEGVLDLGTYIVAGGASLVGADEFAQDAKEFGKKSLTDAWSGGIEDYVDQYSVLGDKADMVSEGVGMAAALYYAPFLGGIGGAGAAGSAFASTMLTTGLTFASGVGSGMSEAYNAGADDGDAVWYGLISGTSEAATELLFGGLGKGSKAIGVGKSAMPIDDVLAKKVSSKMTSQLSKNLTEFGIKSAAEGTEEVLSGFLQAVGKKATYMSEEEFWDIVEDENLLEQFVVGSLTSGIMQSGYLPGTKSGSVREANKTGRDFITGLTQTEQSVVDKVYEQTISNMEKDGKTLSKKQKDDVYQSVLKQLDKGAIDIETIESVLGGDTYKSYKDTVTNEEQLKKELAELSGIESGKLNRNQQKRLAELEAMNLEDTTKRNDLRKQLNDTVFPQLKDSKLAESYNQIAKRQQAFNPDLSKYKGKKREAVERAIKSGVLNDTYRTYELVDVLSTIEADKGIVFDYTNNKKLKEAGFAVDGKTVNGFENNGAVTLNVQSSKSWQSVVGHEITHVLQGTDAYGALQQALYAHAKSRGELDSRKAHLTELYKNMKADVDAELTADLVGDYLFSDTKFIDSLVGNRTLFQKIYDEIKYLCKVATGKELTEIEKVRREFDRAWKEVSTKGVDEVIKNRNAKESVNVNEATDGETENVNFSIREEAPPKETGIAYKVFFVKDGKLYPPMVANPDGADTPMGVWLNADVGTSAPPSKTGRAQVKAGGKGTQGGSGSLAFRPGWHLGDLPRASQFDRVNPETGKKELFPENFVWAEVEYAKDVDYQEEAMSYGYTDNGKFRHAYAGLPKLPENGYYRYRTNPKPDTVPWIITGAMKVNRLLSDAEVNAILEQNGVSPVHRQGGDVGLDKFGFGEDGKVNYSVSETTDGRIVAVVDSDILNNLDITSWDDTKKDVAKNAASSALKQFSNGIVVDGITRKVNRISRREYTRSKYTERLYKNAPDVFADKMRAADIADDVVVATTNWNRDGKLKHPRKDSFVDFDHGTTLIMSGNSKYIAEVIVGITNTGEAVFYDVVDMTPTEFDIKKAELSTTATTQNAIGDINESSAPKTLPQNSENVKKNFSNGTDVNYSMSSIANTFFGDENMSSVAFEQGDYKQTEGYKNYVEQCVNNLRQSRTDFDETVARKEIEDSVDGIVRVAIAAKKAGYDIYDDAKQRSTKDSKKRLLFSSLEPNSDYFTSSDISTICDKRQNFAEIYDDIVRAEEAKGVPKGKRFFDNVDNYFYLHQIMAEKGLTTPCRQCYVESMRKNLAPMASAFLRLVNETNPNNTANDQLYQQSGKNKGNLKSSNAEVRKRVLEELEGYGMTVGDLSVETLTTAEGLAQLKIQAPNVYEAFNSFYGQSKPKMPKAATPFRFGELTALLTDHNGKINQKLVDKINHTGGFRLQSYSDFQIQNYTDVLQTIFEAGTLGLNGHAYTKVPAFLEATEGTHLKRNISIFMYKDGDSWELDRNDSFPYTLDEIYDIVNSDTTGNTSIIAVSQNDDMSAWIMANDYVGYGIPFHKSGLKMNTVRDTTVKTEDGREIKGYKGTKDHTKQQTEVWARASADHKALTKVKKGIDIYKFWDFENKGNLSKNKLIEKNVKKYIDACNEAGYLPKFRDYVMNNGKVLNDVLKYSKELGFVSQDATIADISFEYKGYTIPYGYYKFLGDFGMFAPDGNASPQQPLSLKNYNFDKAVEFFGDAETLRRNEVLQQFANGEERQKYRDSNLTAEQLLAEVGKKRSEVVKSVVPDAPINYSVSADSDGNQLSKEQSEYFKDSKARDDDGNLLVMYHGSQNLGFTVFDPNASDDNKSFFFSDKPSVAASYSNSTDEIAPYVGDKSSGLYKTYLNLTNPYVVDARGARWNNVVEFAEGDEFLSDIGAYMGIIRNMDSSLGIEDFLDSVRGDLVGATDYAIDELFVDEDTGESYFTAEEQQEFRELAERINEAYAEWDEDAHIDEDGDSTDFESYVRQHYTSKTTRQIANEAYKNGYDGVIFKNIVDVGKFANGAQQHYDKSTVAVAFNSNQIKSVDNTTPTSDADIRHSLSELGEQPSTVGTPLKDVALEQTQEAVAPTVEDIPLPTDADAPPLPDEIAPITEEEANALQDEKVKADAFTTLEAVQTELENVKRLRSEAFANSEQKIAQKQAELNAKKNKNSKAANNLKMQIERLKRLRDSTDAEYAKRISNLETREKRVREGKPTTRQAHHNNIMNDIKATFSSSGFDFDDVLEKAKDLSTFSTVDNTPQRVMEKALGYKEGQVLADLTVNKVAQNETEGIKWLNSFLDRKNGLLAQISKQYKIKPGSKESAAAQMYAEGFYVNDNNDIVAYGDAELAKDFPNLDVQRNIKGLAKDQRIRQIYDETLAAINESRTRNAYPEIPRLDNYFLHFRAMEDTFSKMGLPFNPNDIRAKDLPTDLNGVTADLKPGQPYFASAQHRKGKRTSFDLLGGLERYLTSAKNQIYHIDDIQTLRALRNYIADNYGQANGLENIDSMTEEEAQQRISEVFGAHLSTFAKFLNEEANILAGKTSLIDRGLEGILGRRGMTFLNTVNSQVGSNMVGYNISSSLTNFLPVAQTFAKTNKYDFVKAFAQTVSNKFGSIVGKGDSFAENSPVMIRRKGADRFSRTPFQKAADAGYVLMGAVDSISTELIARTKFNELTRKGMDEQQAHFETDKWVSRLMGDRSLGQQPQLFNSKALGVLTKFQLEVRNQLDSQFYDTIKEAKASNEDIENGLAKNAKTAAKVASTFFQLAVAQHLFGKAFESVAGYNPAFDIIEVLSTMLGLDDEEDSEDTALDNIEQGFLELLEDLPYTSTLTGGRIPISSALPVTELIKGEDSYGNEKSRWETLTEVAPYYFMPGGYGQLKKTSQGLGMFSDDHPVSGSYTDSGNLRFPVEDTAWNRVQAGLFGQYASENAREYFDNDYAPLKPRQVQEYIDVDIPIKDYWEYRKGLSKQKTTEDKFNYIAGLDLPVEKKNILINNAVNRSTSVDLETYDDFSSLDEFDFATKHPEKYAVAKSVGGYSSYKTYLEDLYDITADRDEYGKSINGSRKKKVLSYLQNLDASYETKIILFKSEYPSDDTYNWQIINYINGREDLTYDEKLTIFTGAWIQSV